MHTGTVQEPNQLLYFAWVGIMALHLLSCNFIVMVLLRMGYKTSFRSSHPLFLVADWAISCVSSRYPECKGGGSARKQVMEALNLNLNEVALFNPKPKKCLFMACLYSPNQEHLEHGRFIDWSINAFYCSHACGYAGIYRLMMWKLHCRSIAYTVCQTIQTK